MNRRARRRDGDLAREVVVLPRLDGELRQRLHAGDAMLRGDGHTPLSCEARSTGTIQRNGKRIAAADDMSAHVPRRKILIVDDDEDAARLLAHVLGRDHHVDVALDGVAGLEHAQKDPPDILLTDVSMPRLDGVTMVRLLRARGATFPVLFLTANADVMTLSAAIAAGAKGFVPKPIDLDHLEARIRSVLRT